MSISSGVRKTLDALDAIAKISLAPGAVPPVASVFAPVQAAGGAPHSALPSRHAASSPAAPEAVDWGAIAAEQNAALAGRPGFSAPAVAHEAEREAAGPLRAGGIDWAEVATNANRAAGLASSGPNIDPAFAAHVLGGRA